MSKATDRAGKRGTERRICPVQLEVRAASGGGSGKTLDGYATITDTPFEMWDFWGSYTEIIESGAFTKTLSENPQVQLLLNHGGVSMAYTKAGTLRLTEDSTGLHMSADLNTDRGDVRDMVAAISDGAVDEMSFAFRVPAGKSIWVGEDYDQRNIKEVDIHRGDVSVVNFGAVADTAGSLALRSQDFDQLSVEDARVLYERLGRRLAPAAAAGFPLSLARAELERLSVS